MFIDKLKDVLRDKLIEVYIDELQRAYILTN